MSEAKFTKGKWRIGGTGPNGCVPVGTIDGLMVCQTAHSIYGINREEIDQAFANAHLIAAAPEMYNMLEKLISFGEPLLSLDEVEDEEDSASIQANFNDEILRARNLLAKARGES